MHPLVSLLFLAELAGFQESVGELPALSCGPSCLSVVCRIHGRPQTTLELSQLLGPDLRRETSLRELADAAEKLGFATRAVRLNPGDPQLAAVPMIVRCQGLQSVSQNHFVVLYGRNDDGIQVIDFPGPARRFPAAIIARHWDGTGLYVAAQVADLARVPGDAVGPNGVVVTAALVLGAVCATGLIVSLVRRSNSGATRVALPHQASGGDES